MYPYRLVRCAEVSSGICGRPRCQQHQDEYNEVLSALSALEDEYGSTGQTIYDIHYRSQHTLAQAMKDIAAVTRYISLADRIIARKETLRRLDGCCECRVLVPGVVSPLADVAPISTRNRLVRPGGYVDL